MTRKAAILIGVIASVGLSPHFQVLDYAYKSCSIQSIIMIAIVVDILGTLWIMGFAHTDNLGSLDRNLLSGN